MRSLFMTASTFLLIACSDSPADAPPAPTPPPAATVPAAAPLLAATLASPADPALTENRAPVATPLPAGVVQVVIPASRDTTIFESDTAELANGAGDALFVGRNRGGRLARPLLYFDVAAVVPAGAVILEAQLVLRSSRAATGDAVMTLHPALASWGEGGSAANRGEGAGAPAQPGDATWSFRVFPDAPWSSPGGEFGLPGANAHFGEEVATYAWGPNVSMTAQVQAWLDDPASNLGWLLKTQEEPERVTAIRFYSREGGGERSGPRLIVTYAAP